MRVILSLLSICLIFSSCYITRALKYKKYPLEKLDEFPVETFKESENPFQFSRSSISDIDKKTIDSTLKGSNKYAVAVIRNDSILYEWYNTDQKIDTPTILPSFSVAKSYVSTMMQIAKQEGKIKSFDAPITDYLPELAERDERFKKITIQHVLDMRSGIKSSEDYLNPRSEVLKLGFAKNIVPKALKVNIQSLPNLKFEYKSQNTQLLGIILERATGEKLQDYFSSRLQKPLRMQHESTWIYDDEKHKELRAFCCMNLSLLDYAKFGKLYLDGGEFEGKKIIDKEWIDRIFNIDTMSYYDGYNNQFWNVNSTHYRYDSMSVVKFAIKKGLDVNSIYKGVYKGKDFWAIETIEGNVECRGLLNQYIRMYPEKNIIVVHFGNNLNESKPLKKGYNKELKRIFGL